jgi:hypothetical protein
VVAYKKKMGKLQQQEKQQREEYVHRLLSAVCVGP